MRKDPPFPVRILVHISLIFVGVMINLPFFWMVITSFKREKDVFSFPPKFYPTLLSFENYVKAFTSLPILRSILNTLFVAGIVTGLQLVFNVFAAYSFSRLRFPGRNVLFAIFLGTLMIPEEVIMVPLYIMVRSMGLLNTYGSLIIPFMASAFGIFLLRQFFLTIPGELEDAARIDGCGKLKTLWYIILPLSKPALWTMALYTFLAIWNSYLWPLVAISRDDLQLVQVELSRFSSVWETEWTQLMSASTVVVIPIIILFLFVQKQFIQGITLSGLKE